MLTHGAPELKHLRHTCPLSSQKVSEFVTFDQFADFQSPMAKVFGAGDPPILAVGWRLGSKRAAGRHAGRTDCPRPPAHSRHPNA